ncbi:hypothetical protein LJC22_03415 [Desulfosarcina sp. OttesenSCG-928-G10]|nr:hypothetical protein [Desulfosarcina sp. OttesenSCG-928-G10]
MFDADKTKKLFQFILLTAGREDSFYDRELGPIHLLKYAYLADMAYARFNHGKTYTGIEWKFHHYGPWSSQAFLLIDEALAKIGAEKKTIQSTKFDEDFVRWKVDNDRLHNALCEALPISIAGELQKRIHEFGANTTELLHFVYNTPPMLTAAPGETLDFMVVILDPVVDVCPEPVPVELTVRQQKQRKAQLDALKKKVRERLDNRVIPKKMIMTPPRYDEVFFKGVEWLDSLAGGPIEEGQFEAHFSDDIWKSRTRFDPDIP